MVLEETGLVMRFASSKTVLEEIGLVMQYGFKKIISKKL